MTNLVRRPDAEFGAAHQIVVDRSHLFGISAALVTPFAPDGAIDLSLASAHAKRVLESGGDGVTLFGTTGEGASIGINERSAMLEAIQAAGVPAEKITTCIVACAMEQALQQARDCVSRGVRRFLLTPPFYFKSVSDEALFAWFAEFIEKLDQPDVQIILYNIPQVTGVGLSVSLIRKLKDKFEEQIFGVKDSSGVWTNCEKLLKNRDLAILIGDERLLARAAPLGGAGSISGMANLVAGRLSRIIKTGEEDVELSALVDEVVSHPVTPLVKAMVGAQYRESGWDHVRTPLSSADAAVASALAGRLSAG